VKAGKHSEKLNVLKNTLFIARAMVTENYDVVKKGNVLAPKEHPKC